MRESSPNVLALFTRLGIADWLNRRDLGKCGLPSKRRYVPKLVAADSSLRILLECLIQEMPGYPFRLSDQRVRVYLQQLGVEPLLKSQPFDDRSRRVDVGCRRVVLR